MKIIRGIIPGEMLKVRSTKSFYARQKKLFVILVIVISIVPLLIISWTSSHFYRDSWEKQTSFNLAGLATSRKEVISLFLIGQENLLTALVRLYSFEHLADSNNLKNVFLAVNQSGDIIDLGVIDQNGRHRSYVGPYRNQLINKNYKKSEWFQKAMGNGRYVSDVFRGFRGVPHLVVAVTAPDRSWVLRATVNSEMFNALLANTEVGPGGDAFIINARGELQTPLRLGTRIPTPEEINILLNKEQDDIFFFQNFIYAISWMNSREWLLVLKTDVDNSLAEFYAARNRDWIIITAAALLILVVATLMVRLMVGQIEKADDLRTLLINRIRQAEKMALIGRLAAGVAHEVNNPLQIINDLAGYMTELIADEPYNKASVLEECQSSAVRIRAQVKRASIITHRFLGFSRKEGGRRLTNINQLVEESLSFLENVTRNRHIVISHKLSADMNPIWTEPSLLLQVFLNIINNAIDAIGENGEIIVTTAKHDGHVMIEFADTGSGLSDEAMIKIFDPFFTTKEKDSGTGLGLSIAFDIVRRLGGEIHAENDDIRGGGRFTVILPAVHASPEENGEDKAISDRVGLKLKSRYK